MTTTTGATTRALFTVAAQSTDVDARTSRMFRVYGNKRSRKDARDAHGVTAALPRHDALSRDTLLRGCRLYTLRTDSNAGSRSFRSNIANTRAKLLREPREDQRVRDEARRETRRDARRDATFTIRVYGRYTI